MKKADFNSKVVLGTAHRPHSRAFDLKNALNEPGWPLHTCICAVVKRGKGE